MPKKPHAAFPNPAATLPGEADILANVLADLSDHDAKLVYADWLEERDDPRGPLLRDFITAYRAGKKLPAVEASPWRDLVGLTLMEKLRGTVLEPNAHQILALARPAIASKTTKAAETTIAAGASKFGGRPDLPPGTVWPEHEGQPLSFFGQFNLAEFQPSPVGRVLPPVGLLSAFCLYLNDGEDVFPDGSWRVFYSPDVNALERREFDAGLEEESRFPACRVEYREVLTLPHRWAASETIPSLDKSPADDVYSDIYYGMCKDAHLLGHSFPIQGYSLEKKGERHLFTIGPDDATGWEFAGGGSLYFVIGEKQLNKGQLDRARMAFDCG